VANSKELSQSFCWQDSEEQLLNSFNEFNKKAQERIGAWEYLLARRGKSLRRNKP
jgi:hypothetical protein